MEESVYRHLLAEFESVEVKEIKGYQYILFRESIQPDHAKVLTNTGKRIKGILLREAYFKVQQQILKASEQVERCQETDINIHIGGTPGIGKSVFGLFLIFKFVSSTILNKFDHIIYDNNNFNQALLIYNRVSKKLVVCHRNQASVMNITWTSSIYILDNFAPTSALPAHLNIYISSPNKYKATDYHKLVDLEVYMPVWSLDELISCHGALGSTSSQLDVQRVFKMIGGIPRYAIQKLEFSSLAKIREEVVDLILKHPANTLVKYIETTADVDVAYRLLHICPTEHLTSYTVEFGSELIRNAIMYKYVHESEYEAWRFLKSETTSMLRGTVFEEWAHNAVANGGTFFVQRLAKTKKEADKGVSTQIEQQPAAATCDELDLSKKKILFYDFSSDSEAQLLDQINENSFCNSTEMFTSMLLGLSPEERQSLYFKPLKLNHGTLDAFILPDIMLQYTVSSGHSLKLTDDFKSVLQIMRSVSKNNKLIPKIYWVLPEKVFDSFNQKIIPIYRPRKNPTDNKELVVEEKDPLAPLLSVLGSCPQYKLMLSFGDKMCQVSPKEHVSQLIKTPEKK